MRQLGQLHLYDLFDNCKTPFDPDRNIHDSLDPTDPDVFLLFADSPKPQISSPSPSFHSLGQKKIS